MSSGLAPLVSIYVYGIPLLAAGEPGASQIDIEDESAGKTRIGNQVVGLGGEDDEPPVGAEGRARCSSYFTLNDAAMDSSPLGSRTVTAMERDSARSFAKSRTPNLVGPA